MAIRILSANDARALEAAQTRAALFGRDDLVAVTVTGKDRAKFLHNMLTQEVKDLPERAVRLAALCDPQGKMLAVMTLVLQAERIVLWTGRAQAEVLVSTLDRYVIMDDVQLAADEDLALLGVVGPQVAEVAARLELTALEPGVSAEVSVAGAQAVLWCQHTGGREGAPHGAGVAEWLLQVRREDLGVVVPAFASHGAEIGCHAAADALRVLAGRPLLGVDVEDGSLPMEAGLPEAVSLRKGCYMGQEAIAMLVYRGQLRRHLCWVEADAPARPGTGWLLRTPDGKRAGRMGSAVVLPDGRLIGLAMVQRKVYAPGAALVAVAEESGEQAPVRVLTTTVPGVLAEGAGAVG